ncbi:hypothetical protein ACFQZC_38600 [Streptacidiphilus monticola]
MDFTQSLLFDPAPPAPSGRMLTQLNWGLGVESTAWLLMVLDDPTDFGLLPDLSDLTVVHSVVGEEWRDSLDFADQHVLPRLRAARVRLVQVARAGAVDADGITVLDDSRSSQRIWSAGPRRLGDEHESAGTLPSLAGPHECSIKYKGWVLDRWAELALAGQRVRRVIGYNADETRRADKDAKLQEQRNARAGRVLCEPWYPLIERGWTRQARAGGPVPRPPQGRAAGADAGTRRPRAQRALPCTGRTASPGAWPKTPQPAAARRPPRPAAPHPGRRVRRPPDLHRSPHRPVPAPARQPVHPAQLVVPPPQN